MDKQNIKEWLADLPTTVIVVLSGLTLAFLTAFRYLLSGIVGDGAWKPDWEWLAFVAAVIGLNYGVKRATYKESPPDRKDVEDVPSGEK